MPAKKKSDWLLIGIVIAALVVFVGIAVVGAGVYVFLQHFGIERTSEASAEQQFEQTRQRFAGQTPLIEIPRNRDEEVVVHRSDSGAGGKPISSINVLAWNPRESRLVRASIPFWLVRLKGRFVFSSDGFDTERLNLTVDDLERHGPGLILDHIERRVRVLVWAE